MLNEEIAFQEKYNKLFKLKQSELDSLELNQSMYISDKKGYEKKLVQLRKEVNKLVTIDYVNFNDSVQAIAYLVSKMQGVEYVVREVKQDFYVKSYPHVLDRFRDEPRAIKYSVCMLVRKDLQEELDRELEARFHIDENCKKCDYYNLKNQLSIPSNNYIQIAYYKEKNVTTRIQYIYENYVTINDLSDSMIYSKICDERYSYIIEYMRNVVNYKLDKPDLEITLDEMKNLADKFVSNYKNDVKKSLR